MFPNTKSWLDISASSKGREALGSPHSDLLTVVFRASRVPVGLDDWMPMNPKSFLTICREVFPKPRGEEV